MRHFPALALSGEILIDIFWQWSKLEFLGGSAILAISPLVSAEIQLLKKENDRLWTRNPNLVLKLIYLQPFKTY
jgi:hypothetical protein